MIEKTRTDDIENRCNLATDDRVNGGKIWKATEGANERLSEQK